MERTDQYVVGKIICKFLMFIASQDDVYLGFSNTFTCYEIANTTYILREATMGVYALHHYITPLCTGVLVDTVHTHVKEPGKWFIGIHTYVYVQNTFIYTIK